MYLSTRVMFMTQAASLLEAARVRRRPRRRAFRWRCRWRVRPSVGMSLALLETLNDIGASEFLGVQTLTVSVHTTCHAFRPRPARLQIALTMLAIVVGLRSCWNGMDARQLTPSACAR